MGLSRSHIYALLLLTLSGELEGYGSGAHASALDPQAGALNAAEPAKVCEKVEHTAQTGKAEAGSQTPEAFPGAVMDFSAEMVFAPWPSLVSPAKSSTNPAELPKSEREQIVEILRTWNGLIEKETHVGYRKDLLEEEARALLADYRRVFVSALRPGDRKLARDLVREVMFLAAKPDKKETSESKASSGEDRDDRKVPHALPLEEPEAQARLTMSLGVFLDKPPDDGDLVQPRDGPVQAGLPEPRIV
jgi:hypothetical protein